MSSVATRSAMSYGQERLWLLDRLTRNSPAYNNFICRRLRGSLDAELLERSLAEVVRRHESLRMTFRSVAGAPAVRVVEPEPVRVRVLEATGGADPPASQADAEARARRLAREEVGTPFDLGDWPLLRCTLIRLGTDDHVLLITVHHIAADGWSLGLLFDELSELYRAFAEGRAPELPELPVRYSDYAAAQRATEEDDETARRLDAWRERLAGAPTIDLPTRAPRPRVQTFDGSVHRIALPPELGARVAALARRDGATPYMAFLAAFATLLSSYSGQEDLTIGTPIAGRLRPEHERLIGFFANTLVMRVDTSGDPSFRELLRHVRRTAFDAYAHQEVPFERIVKELNVARDLGRNPLFQVMFGVLNTPTPKLDLPGVTASAFEFDPGITRFDLELHLFGAGTALEAEITYNTDLFERAAIEAMAGHLLTRLEGICADPGRRVADLPLLGAGEARRLVERNGAAGPVPPPRATVHGLVEQRAAAQPEAVAASFAGTELTYARLEAEANRLARRLRELGVGPDVRVAVCLPRSLDMVVALLAILKAGGAYVPLDPAYPDARLEYMLEDSGAAVLVTHAALAARLPSSARRAVCIDRRAERARLTALPGGALEPLEPLAGPESLAYVIYTSGSTGRPKGVAMPHRALVNLLTWQNERSRLASPAVTLQLASLSFDVAFQEIFSTLAIGGSLVLIDEAGARDPATLWGAIVEHGVERLFITPTGIEFLARGLAAHDGPARLHDVVSSGELLRVTPAVRALVERTGCTLTNHYGPTETHVVTEHTGELVDGPVPIGLPISNCEAYVLDRYVNLVPDGVTGELCIGGACLARGYLGRPELTDERFVVDRFSARGGARLYRTGDLARWRPDGLLEVRGRLDDQVKVRGFRIELGEVEAQLAQHPALREAAVTAPQDEHGVRRLVAYAVAGDEEVTASALRTFLAQRLPEHMLPSAFVLLDELPLTRSGKVDRRALPAPARGQRPAVDGGYAAPGTRTETVLASIWREVLDLGRIGVDDDFFELGGDSLLASRVAARGDVLGGELAVRQLFEHPTIRELARHLDATCPTAPSQP
jgi:amino acid adenylation domain-containing protein